MSRCRRRQTAAARSGGGRCRERSDGWLSGAERTEQTERTGRPVVGHNLWTAGTDRKTVTEGRRQPAEAHLRAESCRSPPGHRRLVWELNNSMLCEQNFIPLFLVSILSSVFVETAGKVQSGRSVVSRISSRRGPNFLGAPGRRSADKASINQEEPVWS